MKEYLIGLRYDFGMQRIINLAIKRPSSVSNYIHESFPVVQDTYTNVKIEVVFSWLQDVQWILLKALPCISWYKLKCRFINSSQQLQIPLCSQCLILGIFVQNVFATNLNFRSQRVRNLKKYGHQLVNFSDKKFPKQRLCAAWALSQRYTYRVLQTI